MAVYRKKTNNNDYEFLSFYENKCNNNQKPLIILKYENTGMHYKILFYKENKKHINVEYHKYDKICNLHNFSIINSFYAG